MLTKHKCLRGLLSILAISTLLTLSSMAQAIGVNGVDMWLGHVNPREEATVTMQMAPGKTEFRVVNYDDGKFSCLWKDGVSGKVMKEETDVPTCVITGNNYKDQWVVQVVISNKKSDQILFYRIFTHDIKDKK